MASFVSRVEKHYFQPSFFNYLIALFLLPFSLLYTLLLFIRFLLLRPRSFEIPIVSIGNRVMGGSGKTPFTIALAQHYPNAAIVLRGYGRTSKGLVVVRDKGNILCDVQTSGDEAMLYAQTLQNVMVIVSEDREQGILKAKAMGASVVFLDDGYSKHYIKKMDILLERRKAGFLPFCLPSGAIRECLWWGKKALQLYEDEDFFRSVEIENPTSKMILITAIAKPWRLDAFLPTLVAKKTFPDHYHYEQSEVEALFKTSKAQSIVTTPKDAVKLQEFNLPLSIMRLTLSIQPDVLEKIDDYITHN